MLPRIQITTSIGPYDIALVIEMANRHRRELGFVPDTALKQAGRQGKIATAWRGMEFAGYVYFTCDRDLREVTIIHCVVDLPQRRKGIGTQLVNFVGASYPTSTIKASVKTELDAIAFWRTIMPQATAGFNRRSGKPMTIFTLEPVE